MDLTKLWLTGVAVFIIVVSGSGIAAQPPESAQPSPARIAPADH